MIDSGGLNRALKVVFERFSIIPFCYVVMGHVALVAKLNKEGVAPKFFWKVCVVLHNIFTLPAHV